MLKTQLLHPQISAALARAGHGSKVLVSDANYPHSTARGANAEVVYLNLAPGLVLVTDMLKVLVATIPIEMAEIMDVNKSGAYAMKDDPPIWGEFRSVLQSTDAKGELVKIERMAFYAAAGKPDVCLTVATGDQRIYANLLLTIGVVRAKSE